MTPLFADAPDRLPTPQPCAEVREGCPSTQAWLADLDADGDLDALLAHGGAPDEGWGPTLWENRDGVFVDVGPLPGAVVTARQVAVGDVDGGGAPDLLAPGVAGDTTDAVWLRDGGAWTRDDARLGTSSRAGAAALADVDGDLDLDLLITAADDAAGSVGTLYGNDGDGVFTPLDGALPAALSAGVAPVDAEWFDADGDFDPDLLIVPGDAPPALLVNDGFGVFTEAPDALVGAPEALAATSCDVDDDGDLDLWIGAADGGVHLFVNTRREFTAGSVERAWALPVTDLTCADLDADGLPDLLASTLGGGIVALRGAAEGWVAWPEALPASTDAAWALAVGDVDGDGRLDVLSAQGANPDGSPGPDERELLLLGTASQPLDRVGPTFRLVRVDPDVANGAFVTVRMAVGDRAGAAHGRVRVWAQADAEYAAVWAGGDQFVASVPLPLDGEVELVVYAEDDAGNLTTLPLGTLGFGPEDTASGVPTTGACGCASAPRGRGLAAVALGLLAWMGRRRAVR